MYKQLFGLQKLPFTLTPDPEYLYLSANHGAALTGLMYAIEQRKGFVVLTGDAGTGKTTLLGSMMDRFPADRVDSSVLTNPILTPAEFLEFVLLDFGIPDVPPSKAQRLWMLQEFLLRAYRDDRIGVLVIDEAHKLGFDVLEEIRLLGNFEFGAHKFLQIVLIGQSELLEVLDRQDLRQFKQRIAVRLSIEPLSGSEVEKYMQFRWTKAGGGSLPFTTDAVTEIARRSRGIPRVVNLLCDTALLMAHENKLTYISRKHVQEAASSLAIGQPSTPVTVAPPAPAVSGPAWINADLGDIPRNTVAVRERDFIPVLARPVSRNPFRAFLARRFSRVTR